jgi:hypothetical protein
MCTQIYVTYSCGCNKNLEFTQCVRRRGTNGKCKPWLRDKSHNVSHYCQTHLITDAPAWGAGRHVFNFLGGPERRFLDEDGDPVQPPSLKLVLELMQRMVSLVVSLLVVLWRSVAEIEPFPNHPVMRGWRGSHFSIGIFVMMAGFFWFF